VSGKATAVPQPSVLSTHVLNTAQGVPAEGVSVELWRLDPAEELVARASTDADGRAGGGPLLPPAAFAPGRYELRFGVGDYFRRRGLGADPPFHDVVAVRVFLAEGQGHYHVPLLCSPWSYTTYRGS
jgi:5-hydroxyisourate hydrolase